MDTQNREIWIVVQAVGAVTCTKPECARLSDGRLGVFIDGEQVIPLKCKLVYEDPYAEKTEPELEDDEA